MNQHILKNKEGQAAVEMAIIAPIFILLLFFAFHFFELLNIKHATINAARFAVWEAAYANHKAPFNQIKTRTQKYSSLGPTANMEVVLKADDRLSNAFGYFANPLIKRRIQKMGLPRKNCFQSEVTYHYRKELAGMGLKFDLNLQTRQALIADSWRLVDVNGNKKVDNIDLKRTISGLWLYPSDELGVTDVFDFINDGLFDDIMDILSFLVGSTWDIDPRGNPDLNVVPEQER